MATSHTSARIRKIIRQNPEMKDAQVARKIGRPFDVRRVSTERIEIDRDARSPERSEFIREEVKQTGCLAHEAAHLWECQILLKFATE